MCVNDEKKQKQEEEAVQELRDNYKLIEFKQKLIIPEFIKRFPKIGNYDPTDERDKQYLSSIEGNKDIDKLSNKLGKGICHTLSVAWISMLKNEKEEATKPDIRIARLKCIDDIDGKFYMAATAFVNYTDNLTKQFLPRKYASNAAIKPFGIKITHESVWWDIGTIKIHELIHNKLYCILSIQGVNRHSIAIHRPHSLLFFRGDYYLVFDPNFGEFNIPKDDIEKFFDTLLNRVYSATKVSLLELKL